MSEIREKTDNIIYLNFEDRRIAAGIADEDTLIKYVEGHRQKGKCYLFLAKFRYLQDGRIPRRRLYY